MDRFIYGILFLLAVNKPMKQYGDEFMDESDKEKKKSQTGLTETSPYRYHSMEGGAL